MFLKRIFRRFFTLLFVKSNVFFLLKSKLFEDKWDKITHDDTKQSLKT